MEFEWNNFDSYNWLLNLLSEVENEFKQALGLDERVRDPEPSDTPDKKGSQWIYSSQFIF
jgi:hypothetical protein